VQKTVVFTNKTLDLFNVLHEFVTVRE